MLKHRNLPLLLIKEVQLFYDNYLGKGLFSESNGFEHTFCLVHGLHKFVFRDGISDQTGSGLDKEFAVFNHCGTDPDAGVVIAIEAEVTQGAAVWATLAVFELGNNLEGTNFGRTAEGTGRESRPH